MKRMSTSQKIEADQLRHAENIVKQHGGDASEVRRLLFSICNTLAHDSRNHPELTSRFRKAPHLRKQLTWYFLGGEKQPKHTDALEAVLEANADWIIKALAEMEITDDEEEFTALVTAIIESVAQLMAEHFEA